MNSIPQYKPYGTRDLGCAYYKRKRVYFPGPYNSRESVVAYREWLGTILREQPKQRLPPVGQLTISEVCERWLAHVSSYYQSPGERMGALQATGPLRVLYGALPVGQFGVQQLSAVRDSMVAGQIVRDGETKWKRPKKWSREYVNKQIGRLRRMLAWGAEQGIVPSGVTESARFLRALMPHRTPAHEMPEVIEVDDAVIEATLEQLTPVQADMVRFQRLTGARPGNVCDLRPREIDRGPKTWLWRPSQHKTLWRGEELVIPVGPKARAIITPYLDRDPDAYCFSPSESWRQYADAMKAKAKRKRFRPKAKPTSRIFSQHYTEGAYCHLIHRAAERAGVSRWSPHRVRHTAAKEARDTYGLDGAQKRLRHKSANITQIYARLTLEQAATIAEEIG